MNIQHTRFSSGWLGLTALVLCGAISLHAQQRGNTGNTGNRSQGVQRNTGGGGVGDI